MTAHDAPLAVTMGDPSGIGPEIIAKMYLRRPDKRHWIVVGDPLVMTRALCALDADVRVRPIASVDETVLDDGTLNVLCSSQLSALPPVSQVSAVSGVSRGMKVRHETFGVGIVTDIEEQGDDYKITVRFNTAGLKKLLAKYARLVPA